MERDPTKLTAIFLDISKYFYTHFEIQDCKHFFMFWLTFLNELPNLKIRNQSKMYGKFSYYCKQSNIK